MALTRSFSAMLNDYLPNELFSEEMVMRDYVLQKVEKDSGWQGGDLIVPFVGASASSIEYGALPASTDIAEDQFLRGTITGPGGMEVNGAMIFNQRDLEEHPGSGIKEKTFLKILPDRVEAFMQTMKQNVSVSLLSGNSFAKVVADTDLANGIVEVDHVDRFYIGQKVSLDDDNSSPTSYYVIAINHNGATLATGTGTVTLSAARGSTAASLTAYTLAQNSKFYHPGSQASTFTSLRQALLSLANGGATNHHGLAKTAWPILQAVNQSGATITATNILDKCLDLYT